MAEEASVKGREFTLEINRSLLQGYTHPEIRVRAYKNGAQQVDQTVPPETTDLVLLVPAGDIAKVVLGVKETGMDLPINWQRSFSCDASLVDQGEFAAVGVRELETPVEFELVVPTPAPVLEVEPQATADEQPGTTPEPFVEPAVEPPAPEVVPTTVETPPTTTAEPVATTEAPTTTAEPVPTTTAEPQAPLL